MKNTFIVLLLICVSALNAFGRDFTVSVAVQADSEETGQKVEKYLTEQLSTLSGVKLGDEGQWSIKVMVTENRSEGKVPTYTISAVITSESKCAVLNGKSKVISSEGCDKFENFGVFAGTQTDLKEMCEELIADFNEGNLEPLR
jgi:hypothetical protein